MAARALPGLRDPAALGAWLRRTTYRTCLDLLRRDARLDFRSPEDMPESAAVGPDPAELVAANDAVSWLLAMLPLEQRLVMILVDQEELDYRSAAELLGVPSGTIASRLSLARATLRRALMRELPQETQ